MKSFVTILCSSLSATKCVNCELSVALRSKVEWSFLANQVSKQHPILKTRYHQAHKRNKKKKTQVQDPTKRKHLTPSPRNSQDQKPTNTTAGKTAATQTKKRPGNWQRHRRWRRWSGCYDKQKTVAAAEQWQAWQQRKQAAGSWQQRDGGPHQRRLASWIRPLAYSSVVPGRTECCTDADSSHKMW